MDIAFVSSAIATAKGLMEMASTIKDVKIADEVRERSMQLTFSIYELQKLLLEEQAANRNSIEKIRDLEAKMADIEQWEAKAHGDSLEELAAGVYVYRRSIGVGETTRTVDLCTNCYADRKESILQYSSNPPHGRHFVCPRCKSVVVDHSKNRPSSGSF